MYTIKGIACKSKITKQIIHKLNKESIPVIKHRAIDLVAAQELKYKNVKAIINFEKTIDERCNLEGVRYLLESNIKIYEIKDNNIFELITDGDFIEIDTQNNLLINNIKCATCQPVTKKEVIETIEKKRIMDQKIQYCFVKNTILYMDNELSYFLHDRNLPELITDIKDREVVIITRGRGYREDLRAIIKFISAKRPIIISVDGGANAVTDMGLRSNIIIGDMDSVSERSLLNCDEILIHTYIDGRAPGLERIKSLKLDYKLIPLKGTSEDAAIYTAYKKGASTIYLIGSHSCIDEFIEKGRKGMGSTALLRMMLGSKIVDLKGISNISVYENLNLFNTSTAVI